jgi:hypothetical protein
MLQSDREDRGSGIEKYGRVAGIDEGIDGGREGPGCAVGNQHLVAGIVLRPVIEMKLVGEIGPEFEISPRGLNFPLAEPTTDGQIASRGAERQID